MFFQGEGDVKLNYVLFFKWGGHKSRQADHVPHV